MLFDKQQVSILFSVLRNQGIAYSFQFQYLTRSNSLIENLRETIFTQLYLKVRFYSQCPYHTFLSQNDENIFRYPENALMKSASQEPIDSSKTPVV